MKYFLLKTDPIYTTAPNVVGWFQLLDKKSINKELHHKLKDRMMLEIWPSEHTVFTDLITSPSLMVSDTLKKVIAFYDPTIVFKEIVLMNKESGLCSFYSMPILDKLECLSVESILLPNRYGIEKAVIDLDKVQSHALFKIDGVLSDYYVIRLDMAESFLRRGAKGFSLIEVECKGR